jgi:hypothetical protein
MKHIYLIIGLLVFGNVHVALGQADTVTKTFRAITGIVVGEDELPIAFATITLLKNNKALTDRTCSEQGYFILDFPWTAQTIYAIRVSHIGHQPAVVTFMYPDTIAITKIKLIRQSNTLQSVTVKEDKPMVERKIDRLVFNLENSIAVKGTSLTEALRLTPMLKVTDNGLSIIGKGGVAVMINERLLHLSGASLMGYLSSLRADDIERIEVLTTPPAKYEARGNGGMVNIVLKKNPGLGWSGNISGSYMQRTYAGYTANTNLNYQSKQISSSLKLRYINSNGIIREQNEIQGPYAILNRSTRRDKYENMGGNFSLNYKISSKTDIGFIYDRGQSDNTADVNLYGNYQSNGAKDSLLTTTSNYGNPISTQILNIYYDQKLNSKGNRISTGINFFNNTPENSNVFTTYSDHSSEIKQIKTYSLVTFRVWSAQSDLTLPYKWATVETGIKFNHFSNNADVQYYNYLQQAYVLDNSRSNLFNYTEKNYAAYISVQKQLNKQWGAKAGLRYEYIHTEGYSPTTHEKNELQYGNVFPTAYLSYKADAKNTFALSYAKRINRPSLRLVNPFRFYTNPYAYFTGNPLLRPSFLHNIELSYLYKGILSFVLFGNRLNDGYGDLTTIEDGIIISSPQNYLTRYNGGLTATLNIKIYPWWEHSSYASYYFSSARSSIATVAAQRGSGFNYSVNNSFRLNKMLSAFLNYSQTLPSIQNNSYSYNQSTLSLGARASLLDNTLQLGISGLKGTFVKYRMYFKDFEQYISTNYDYRTVFLNASYNFGRKKVRGNTKNVNFGEKQRAN